MKKYLIGFWFSMPVQLLLLHFRRYQVFLIFWYILVATIAGYFMKPFGADSLFLAPEYFDQVTPFSVAIVGVAIGVFIMSWNITTFILFSKYFKFLVTTAQPFLKYCINNAVIPLLFLIYYLISFIHHSYYEELFPASTILLLSFCFVAGLFLAIFISFIFFWCR